MPHPLPAPRRDSPRFAFCCPAELLARGLEAGCDCGPGCGCGDAPALEPLIDRVAACLAAPAARSGAAA